MVTALFVAVRVVANPVSNVLQKQLAHAGAHPLFVVGATHAVLTAALAPALFAIPAGALAAAFWLDILLAVVLAVAGNALLVAALQRSELSLLGPVNAYKAVLSLGLSALLIGEVPSLRGLAGVLLILGGSAVIVEPAPGAPGRPAVLAFFRERGVQLRLGALVLSATEAVFLKRALLASSPETTFVLWAALGLPVAGAGIGATLRRGVARELGIWRARRSSYLSLAVTTGVMQLATLSTFGVLQVGYSLALFQLSSLLSVLLGWRYFGERALGRRLAGAALMVGGAVLIAVAGTTGR